MDKELIEKMKKNLARTSALSYMERNLLDTVGKKNCVILSEKGEWIDCMTSKPFEDSYRYRIRQDYTPDPEVIRCEVYQDGPRHVYDCNDINRQWISNAVSHINFIAYEYAGNITSSVPRRIIDNSKQPAEYPVAVLFTK